MSSAAEALVAAVRTGDRRALARAITLVESTRDEDRRDAIALLSQLSPFTGNALRIGVSGVPGVGKSTFIEALGNHIIEQGRQLAVLSVDPSSALSGGSILGDKTRMETLARRAEAFIRPSPAGGALGGVAHRTREAMLVCEAAGFDVVIIETVGVGQSETAVAEMSDLFILLLLPGGGDELQGIKRGIVELADLVLVNKADGELEAAAGRAVADYANALHLLRPKSGHWRVPVEACSALQGTGIAQVWRHILRHHEILSEHGEIAARRSGQALAWMWNEVTENLITAVKAHPDVKRRLAEVERAVSSGGMSPAAAAGELIEAFMRTNEDGDVSRSRTTTHTKRERQ